MICGQDEKHQQSSRTTFNKMKLYSSYQDDKLQSVCVTQLWLTGSAVMMSGRWRQWIPNKSSVLRLQPRSPAEINSDFLLSGDHDKIFPLVEMIFLNVHYPGNLKDIADFISTWVVLICVSAVSVLSNSRKRPYTDDRMLMIRTTTTTTIRRRWLTKHSQRAFQDAQMLYRKSWRKSSSWKICQQFIKVLKKMDEMVGLY